MADEEQTERRDQAEKRHREQEEDTAQCEARVYIKKQSTSGKNKG